LFHRSWRASAGRTQVINSSILPQENFGWRVCLLKWPLSLMTAFVQVFGRRDDNVLHALRRPAAEKRQGTKSRAMVQRRCRGRYGDLATGYGLRRLERGCGDRLSAK